MSKFRITLLALIAIVMIAVIIATWGSLGSAVLVFGLIMGIAGLLYQHFLINRDEDDFQSE